jgi:hypothetical protein
LAEGILASKLPKTNSQLILQELVLGILTIRLMNGPLLLQKKNKISISNQKDDNSIKRF